MLPTLLGLTVAMVFGIFAHGYYGTEHIVNQQWIDVVFWSLIGTGIGVSMMQIFGDCVPCQLSRRVHVESLSRLFCDRMHCGS